MSLLKRFTGSTQNTDKHITRAKGRHSNYAIFATIDLYRQWQEAKSNNYLRVRYCGTSHSPCSLECSSGGGKAGEKQSHQRPAQEAAGVTGLEDRANRERWTAKSSALVHQPTLATPPSPSAAPKLLWVSVSFIVLLYFKVLLPFGGQSHRVINR